MSTITSFEEIKAWKLARELAKEIYAITREDAFARDFGLKDQIRRASVAIMANLAEGFERGGDKEFIQFISIAKSSSAEVRSHLYVALDAAYINNETFSRLYDTAVQINKLLSGLMKYLQNSNLKGAKYK